MTAYCINDTREESVTALEIGDKAGNVVLLATHLPARMRERHMLHSCGALHADASGLGGSKREEAPCTITSLCA